MGKYKGNLKRPQKSHHDEYEWIKAVGKLQSRMSRLRLSNEDEQIIIKIANKL